VGTDTIVRRESGFTRRAIASWRRNRSIEILGDPDGERLPIVSFVVHGPGGRRLHHHFVVALLNDLFGIQARGGCSCAGPYGHHLLRISPDRAEDMAAQAAAGWLGMNPGWTRLSFSYYLSEETFEYLVAAVDLVATFGGRLQPLYRFDPRTGLWSHRDQPPAPPGLAAISYRDGMMFHPDNGPASAPDTPLTRYLDDARAIIAAAPRAPSTPDADPATADEFERLRWFDLPAACVA
jgi:hypothetical protein